MAVYLVIENGVAVNRIEWDGETPYDPGEGRELLPEESAEAPTPDE
ncbi:MAG: hypothetical protein ABW023_16750 [Sphingomonas sp.]